MSFDIIVVVNRFSTLSTLNKQNIVLERVERAITTLPMTASKRTHTTLQPVRKEERPMMMCSFR